jgi:hypothetical protein
MRIVEQNHAFTRIGIAQADAAWRAVGRIDHHAAHCRFDEAVFIEDEDVAKLLGR